MSCIYDGSLPKSVKWSGEVNGTISAEYDSNMRVTSQSINGGGAVSFRYDRDGLITQAGAMSIERELETGRISGTKLGNVTTSQSYDNYDELSRYQVDYNNSPIFQTGYIRDSLGRIVVLNETIQDQIKVMRYEYDIAGRLKDVWCNDTLISTYMYDSNGNRVTHSTPRKTDSSEYDSQDRLLRYGNTQYYYTSNGELKAKIEGMDTTYYTYDYFGNLMTVQLPNRERIDYIIDGQNRRIGKKINGKIVKRWIYSGQITPVAELDSAGNVIAQFVGDYMIKSGLTYQFIVDHLGSVRLVVDVNNGNIVQRLDYDEFGNIILDTNPGFQPFGYAYGLYDVQTKLTRFGVRDYDALIGRWTKKDPIGFGGGVSNLYEYAVNDPINLFDVTGFQLTDAQIANVIFNETRSLSGPDIATARQNMAHAIINGDNTLGENRPITAPTEAVVPENERETYAACQRAVTAARQDIQNGIDPTNGAMNFNMRNGPSRRNFFGTLVIQTQVGPLQNSYTGGGLGRDSVYANTYR